MNEVGGVFGQSLEELVALSRDSRFKACFLASSDLAKFASMANFKHGVFIAEVLESVFLQIGQMLSRHDVPPRDRAAVAAGINKNLSLLSEAYKAEDKPRAYEILEDLRFDATKFQITCINTTEPVGGGTVAW